MEPLPILEEIRRVVRIELVPPLLGVVIETGFVEVRDRRGALRGVLGFAVGIVGRVRDYVVPGIELKDVVCRFEIPRAKLERVATFEIVGWIMRAVRRKLGKRLYGYAEIG